MSTSNIKIEKRILSLMALHRFLFVSYTYLSTCLTGWVYDQELGLYWLNRVEAPLLNQIPCGGLICIASVDFICWNCAFAIVILLVFRSRFNVCPVLSNEIAIHFSNSQTLQAFRFGLNFSWKLTLRFI